MSCVTLTEFFPHFNESVSLKKILTHDSRWFDCEDVVKSLHFSKSHTVLLQHVEPWAVKKFKDICKDLEYTVDRFNEMIGERFHGDKIFINDHGVYQLMIGSTRSPSNAIRHWCISQALKPEENYPQQTKKFKFTFPTTNSEATKPFVTFPFQSNISNKRANSLSPQPIQSHYVESNNVEKNLNKCKCQFELKIPYECDTNLIICDSHNVKYRLVKL